jgi:hypothetical protein
MNDFDLFWDKVEATQYEDVSYSLLAYVETLIVNSASGEDLKNTLLKDIERMTEKELKELIEMLLPNQTCPIESGRNYSQTDIKNKLKQLLKNG